MSLVCSYFCVVLSYMHNIVYLFYPHFTTGGDLQQHPQEEGEAGYASYCSRFITELDKHETDFEECILGPDNDKVRYIYISSIVYVLMCMAVMVYTIFTYDIFPILTLFDATVMSIYLCHSVLCCPMYITYFVYNTILYIHVYYTILYLLRYSHASAREVWTMFHDEGTYTKWLYTCIYTYTTTAIITKWLYKCICL